MDALLHFEGFSRQIVDSAASILHIYVAVIDGRKFQMGFNEKMAEGLTAKGSFSSESVINLLDDIIEAMGNKATILEKNSDNMLLGFAMSGAQKAMNFNALSAAASALTKSKDIDLTADVTISTAKKGRTKITTTIKDANTSQVKGLGFIPLSPKSVLGITTFREFNGHFKQGLLRLDSGAKISIRES